MTTAAAVPRMEERKSTELQQWDCAEGTQVEGILVRRGPESITDRESGEVKEVLGMTVEHEDGARTKFLATYELADKIRRNDLGKLVRITYQGETSIGGGARKRRMKTFRVFVSADKVKTAAALGITDEDIPF